MSLSQSPMWTQRFGSANNTVDCLGASRWFGSAAAAGVADFENSFAWFLATCPDPEFLTKTRPRRSIILRADAVGDINLRKRASGRSRRIHSSLEPRSLTGKSQ